MMKKIKLLNIPLPAFEGENRNIAADIPDYIFTADVVKLEQGDGDIFVFTVFSNNKTPVLRVFASRNGRKTLTYLYSKEAWGSGSLDRYLSLSGYYSSTYIYRSQADRDCGQKYFGGAQASLESLRNFQKGILETALHKRHRNEDAKINALMKRVPKLPADWEKWIDGSVLKKSRYIYYRRLTKKRICGFCTHCKTDVELSYAKHGKEAKCPQCKSNITFKAVGRAKKVYDCEYAVVIQRLYGSTDLVVREFRVERAFLSHYRSPYTKWIEQRRRFLLGDGSSISYIPRWQYTHEMRTSEWRVCNQEICFKQHLYTKRLTAALKNTLFEYCGIKHFAKRNQNFIPVISYLQSYQKYPSIEYLQKMGLNTLVSEIADGFYSESFGINLSEKTPEKVFDVPKQLISFFRKVDIGHWCCAVVKMCVEKGKRFSESDMKLISSAHLDHECLSKVGKLLEYTSLSRIINYFSRRDMERYYSGGFLSTWLDYLHEAQELEYDLSDKSILMPRDLIKAHDATSKIMLAKRNAEHSAKIVEMCERTDQMFAYASKEMLIRAPMNADELINEGATLNHCVGTYIPRIAEGQTMVLFIRMKNKPDTPFYTVSIDKNADVRQVEGANRTPPTKEVTLFIQKWQKRIQIKKGKAA